MSWKVYGLAILFFTAAFAVVYAVTYSVLLSVYENYLRYYQRADLQWTGPESHFPRLRIRFPWLLLPSLLTAWLIVHFVISP